MPWLLIFSEQLWNFFLSHRFVKVIVDHAHRPEAATGQALDEFDAVFAVLAPEQMSAVAVVWAVNSGMFAESIQQFVSTRHRAGECATHPDMMFSGRFPAKHG